MFNAVRTTSLVAGLTALSATTALAAGKYGFADVAGGSKNDPVIEIAASIGPNQGAVFSITENQANDLYKFNGPGTTFLLTTPMPTIPQTANGANQFIRIKFPMKLTKKVLGTILKNKASLQPTSFLTPRLTIIDETGAHVPGVATVNGKTVDGTNIGGSSFFPTWLDTSGANLLLGQNLFTYIADNGDGVLDSTICAFGPTPGSEETSAIKEIRIRLDEIGGVTVNGFWVLKIGDGAGAPIAPQSALSLDPDADLTANITASAPVSPPKFKNGNQVVQPETTFTLRFSEPVVPISVGFSAEWVKDFNSDNPPFPLYFNGNTAPVPNWDLASLTIPIYPNLEVVATPTGVTTFRVPYNTRPINPNNLSEYVVNPLIEIPAKLDLTVRSIALSNNSNPTAVGTVSNAVTSLYNTQFNDTTPAAERSFHTNKGRNFVNVPVAPQAIYSLPVSGTGISVINLDGNGYETNNPETSRILVMTNLGLMCNCSFGVTIPGPTSFGCNPNTFGDASGVNPIGLAGNPPGHLGGPTPMPGINEGSTGSTANIGVGGATNPLAIFPQGFETVARDAEGNTRVIGSPIVGALGDVTVGDFLDKLYYDTNNASVYIPGLHASLETFNSAGFALPLSGNSAADPPTPNPPPLRLPVGLPPVDIVYNQQKLFKPAFVLEGDEVWSAFGGCPPTNDPLIRVSLVPQSQFPYQGDSLPAYAQNGPAWQTFTLIGTAYSARQQIGNFLYATDRDQGVIHVLNSNNFTIVDQIETPDPEGLGLSPDLTRLYVANYGDDSMSVIDTDPISPSLHKELTRVNVEGGPLAVTVQPEHEDVFVCNYFGNSVSIFDPQTSTIRKTLISSINRPFDVCVSTRQNLNGFMAAIYYAYIGNQGTGTITIYESGPTDVGLDDIRWAVTSTDTSTAKFPTMRGLLYDPLTFPGSFGGNPSGVYIAHRDGETGLPMISRVAHTEQKPTAGILQPLPPPNSVLGTPGTFKRSFEVVGTWGGPLQPLGQLNLNGQDLVPYDMALSDINCKDFFSQGLITGLQGLTNTNAGHFFPQNGGGGPNSKSPLRLVGAPPAPFPVVAADRMYVSFAGDNRIEVVDPQSSGARLNRIDGVPLPGKLTSYFDL